MKKFELIVNGEIFEGMFDTNSTSEETLYVLFQHNGMIGVKNPTDIPLSKIKHYLFEYKDEIDLAIGNDEFKLYIGNEE